MPGVASGEVRLAARGSDAASQEATKRKKPKRREKSGSSYDATRPGSFKNAREKERGETEETRVFRPIMELRNKMIKL